MQTKMMGTLVGNLCVGTPASDVAPALYALGARVRIAGVGGDREIPIEEFFVASGQTAVQPHELVTEIVVPAPAAGSAGAFLKLSKTSEDIAKVNVAVTVALSGGVCSLTRIAVGSAAPTPIRVSAAPSGFSPGGSSTRPPPPRRPRPRSRRYVPSAMSAPPLTTGRRWSACWCATRS
jgi:CO/xanthine dehydrogenase FAD-binding subunit